MHKNALCALMLIARVLYPSDKTQDQELPNACADFLMPSDRPNDGNLLHQRLMQHPLPDVKNIVFLCNDGLDVNEKDRSGSTPLHILFYVHPERAALDHAVILLWHGANPFERNEWGYSPVYTLRDNPSIVATFNAVVRSIPEVREQHAQRYIDELTKYIDREAAKIVMTYVRPNWTKQSSDDLNELVSRQPNNGILPVPSCGRRNHSKTNTLTKIIRRIRGLKKR